MIAAAGDTIEIRNNSWYGVKGAVLTLAGGTAPSGIDASWLGKAEYGNVVDKSSPAGAMLENPFPTNVDFNPAIKTGSPLANSAAFAGKTADSFFEKVAFRGAFGLQRWDLPWSEYDPVNREYRAKNPTSVREDDQIRAGITGSVFPNPTMDAATVRYQLANADVVTVRLTDATGAVAATFFANAAQQAGVYEFRLITADLATGLYYLTISGERGTMTTPVTVTR
jgi:hypothetical protein